MHFVIGRQTIFCVFMCSRFGVHLRTPKKQNTISPNDRIGLNYIIHRVQNFGVRPYFTFKNFGIRVRIIEKDFGSRLCFGKINFGVRLFSCNFVDKKKLWQM